MPVRRAQIGDIPRVVELWKEMWDLHRDLDPPRYVSTPAAELVIGKWIDENLRGDRSFVLVAEEGSQVVGYLLGLILENPPVVPDQFFGYISEVAVTASARRRGIGKELLTEGERWFREKGFPYIEVNVSAKNPEAIRFWKGQAYSDYLHRLRKDL